MALAVSLVVLLGGTLASAAFGPESGTAVAPAAAAQPAPPTNQPPIPIPTVDPDPCGPGSPPLPICTLPTPTTTPPMTGLPLPTEVPTLPPCDPAIPLQQCAPTGTTTPSTPCTGEGCIPQPGTTTAPPTNPGTGQPGQGEETEDDCGITDIGACITEAINSFFRGIVTEALNPLLDLLSKTLLTTPMPDSLPRVGELWDNSWQILLISYGLLVLLAGVIAMGYQTVQTRHSIKELAPRLVVGFLAGALSLWVATKGIQIANALVAAIMGGGVDANSAGETLRNLVLSSLNGGIWIIFIGIFLAGMLVALLVTYVVRVAMTIILIAGAPLALMFHALPQTEGIAYWWWKAYGGCLAIQLGQSLTLITAMKVFLAPGGFTLFGPTMSGLVNLLVALALMYILFKIPFWVLSSVRGGGGRSGLIGSLVKGFLAYKTFGLLGGGGGGGKSPKPRPSGGGRGGNGGGGSSGGNSSSNPYANARTTGGGQYVLPLPGVRRTRPTGKPTPKPKSGPTPKPSGLQGRQLALPLGEDWPENKPVLGRDGQYRLPLDVQRTTPPPTSPAGADTGGRRTRTAGGKQLELPLDPYRGNRPNRSGQYPLPLDGVRRVPRPASPPPPPSPRPSGRRVVQPELPFDPYKGNRATRGGQYPLPLDGLRRAPAPKPAPAPPPAASATPPRPAPRAGQQLRLPLDLPKPAKPPTTPVFSSPPSPPSPPPPPARPSPKPGGKTS
ncbi:Outer membrane protein, OmpA/MotB family [Alloactinosynnema sp. L-07]|nr:Outer membrane protein, OmpA/MotB family [Alloactinosynnema sp. L-07]